MDALRRYHYPGNVRELQNIIERAAVLARGQTIDTPDLPDHLIAPADNQPAITGRVHGAAALQSAVDDALVAWTPMHLEDALREPERRILQRALDANQWNRQKTSEQLGINRTTLYKKMKALGLLGPHEHDLPGDPLSRLTG